MKKIIAIILLLTFLFEMSAYAEPSVSAKAAMVMDMASKRVLYSKNSDKKLGMASTTKIMTAIVALEYSDLNSIVKVSPTAYGVEGSSMYLMKGEEITLENLVYGLMLVSGNDAATAIAEHISGSVPKFAELMNQKAEEIGAKNTHFDNPHGLDSDLHYTTAYDLALITAYGLKNPKFREIVSSKTKKMPWAEHNYGRVLNNHNKLLTQYEGCIGVKTGFTKATGRCLVSAVQRNNMVFVCVTLNDPNDWADHKNLYDYLFDRYRPFKVVEKETEFDELNVKHGLDNGVKAATQSDFYFPLAEGENFSTIKKINDDLEAPLSTNDVVGYVGVEMGGDKYLCYPLYPSANVEMRKLPISIPESNFKVNIEKIFIKWFTVFS